MDLKERLEMVRMGGNNGKGRKAEVLRLLKAADEGIEIKELAEQIGISRKNVSSQLSYLRGDGFIIGDMGEGKRILLGRKKGKIMYIWDGKEFVKESDIK